MAAFPKIKKQKIASKVAPKAVKQRKTKAPETVQSVETEIATSGGQTTSRFVEDSQIIEMEVSSQSSNGTQSTTNQANSEFELSDVDENLSSDDEVNFKSDSQQELSDGEIEEEAELEVNRTRSAEPHSNVVVDKQAHIRAIDLEMKQRLSELHELMHEGGLVESAELLKTQFELNNGTATAKNSKQKVKTSQPPVDAVQKGNDSNYLMQKGKSHNCNQNATMRLPEG